MKEITILLSLAMVTACVPCRQNTDAVVVRVLNDREVCKKLAQALGKNARGERVEDEDGASCEIFSPKTGTSYLRMGIAESILKFESLKSEENAK